MLVTLWLIAIGLACLVIGYGAIMAAVLACCLIMAWGFSLLRLWRSLTN